jgi:dTDP-4-dehydrorhamnose reductase
MARTVVTGAAGQLGRQLVSRFQARGDEVLAMRRPDFEITDPATARTLATWGPDLVVNAAAWTDVDGCARDPERATAVNGRAAGTLAAAAASVGARFVQVSTNEVFAGSAGVAYMPDSVPRPITPYGMSKLTGERAVASANDRHLIVRTAWLFGPGGRNFVTKILAAARLALDRGGPLRVVADEVGNPTWAPALADQIVDLASTPQFPSSIVHVAGTPPASRLEWSQLVFAAAGVRVPIQPVSLRDFSRPSPPPIHAVLVPSPGVAPIDWRAATIRYVADLEDVSA